MFSWRENTGRRKYKFLFRSFTNLFREAFRDRKIPDIIPKKWIIHFYLCVVSRMADREGTLMVEVDEQLHHHLHPMCVLVPEQVLRRSGTSCAARPPRGPEQLEDLGTPQFPNLPAAEVVSQDAFLTLTYPPFYNKHSIPIIYFIFLFFSFFNASQNRSAPGRGGHQQTAVGSGSPQSSARQAFTGPRTRRDGNGAASTTGGRTSRLLRISGCGATSAAQQWPSGWPSTARPK